MRTGGIFVQTNHISQIGSGKQFLSEGSQVLVRVISDKGGGKYEGSVAGVKVNLQSYKPLKLGSTFLASITTKDGTIFVSPNEKTPSFQKPVQINTIQTQEIATFLQRLGVPSDELSLHLFQQLKQMGMKIDSDLIMKLRRTALKFGGKEKSASEILLILKEKGLNASDDEIQFLLNLLDYSNESSDENHERNNKKYELLNKINKTPGKWYILPYEIVQKSDLESSSDSILGSGFVKLFITDGKVLKYMNVDCNYSQKRYLFNLEYENKIIKNVRMNISDDNKKSVEIFKNRLCHVMNNQNIKVEWEQAEKITGTSCGLETISTIGGLA